MPIIKFPINIDQLRDPRLLTRAIAAGHESGHALIRELRGRPYRFVTLGRDGEGAHLDTGPLGPLNPEEIEDEVLCALAGGIAQAMLFPNRPATESALCSVGDQNNVRDLLGERVRDKALLERLLVTVEAMLEANLRQLKRIAKALHAQGTLTPSEVRASFAGMPLTMPEITVTTIAEAWAAEAT